MRLCQKKKLYKAFIISRSHEAELKYKSYKNKLTSILRFAEKAYYSKLLEKQTKNNVKGIWKILNTIINKQFNPPTYLAMIKRYAISRTLQMDLIIFLQMLDPILQNKLLYLKRMYLCLIIWEKNLIKVCF